MSDLFMGEGECGFLIMASTIDPLIRLDPSKDLVYLIQRILHEVDDEGAVANVPTNIMHFRQGDKTIKVDNGGVDDANLTVDDVKWVYERQKQTKNKAEQEPVAHGDTPVQRNGW